MTLLYLLDPDDTSGVWAPFLGARPIAELRAGAWRIRERWERALGIPAAVILSDRISGYHELDEPAVRPIGPIRGPAVIARSDFAPADAPAPRSAELRRLVAGERIVAWLVPDGGVWSGPAEDGPAAEIAGVEVAGTVGLISALEALLPGDCAAFGLGTGDPLPAGTIVIGNPHAVILRGAVVEPGVVFDVRNGPVVLDEAVEVRSGTRLEGPLYAGAATMLLGGHIRQSSFGPHCRVKGEVSNSVFLGYANKSHDGFVGHSVLGHWVNLGALTTTSNLKNTYGPVQLEVAGHRLETGRTFVGSLLGDHVKTAIGTMLSTGTVVGTGANLFGAAPVPRYVPPFAWGNDLASCVTEAGFLQTAGRVLPRRGVELTSDRRNWLTSLHRRSVGGSR